MPRSVEFRATCTLAAVRRVTADVRAWCRARVDDPDACRGIELAVDEACTNIVRHAHPNDPSAVFHVRLDLSPGALRVTVTDRGPRFAGESRPGAARKPGGGGLGLLLMREAMHDVTWHRRGGVNILRMTRTLQVPAPRLATRSRDPHPCPLPPGW